MWPTLLLSFLLFGGIQFVHSGQYDANSAVYHNNWFNVASSSMQGIRKTMEDAHSHVLPLTAAEPNSAYFGVFDGHGGESVALLASQELHKFILKELEHEKNVSEALKKGFMAFDENANTPSNEYQGATANVVIIKGDYLYCANAGDSRAVRSVDGVAQPLSIDHKPTDKAELGRIKAAGGILYRGRVCIDTEGDSLTVSRALGDFYFKKNTKLFPEKQIITALPDVQSCKISDDLEFVILACDGVWDVMTNEAAVDFVRKRMADDEKPEEICEQIVKHCLANAKEGRGDNMTVLLVSFLRGKPYSELCKSISQKYYKRTGTELSEKP